jgi:dienelactone hydrolase
MADVLLFHHAQGLTSGVREFAETLRGAGHTVHLPDAYEGRTFDDVTTGVGHAREIGFGTLGERADAVVQGLPNELVYLGFSLGVMQAQRLAQTRAGAKGAILAESCVPSSEFGGPWPKSLPLQIHGMADDEFFAREGDLDAACTLMKEAADAELFVYPGDKHLFADSSIATYDKAAAALLTERVLSFLARI